MFDIYFKCTDCEKQLVAGVAGAGQQIICPRCNSSLTIPAHYSLHACPNCLKILQVDSLLRGTEFHCPFCTKTIVPLPVAHVPGGIYAEASEIAMLQITQ